MEEKKKKKGEERVRENDRRFKDIKRISRLYCNYRALMSESQVFANM